MDERQLLLRAICTHPAEDTPRLAYADYLDGHGLSPWHAELIRLQCARVESGVLRRAVRRWQKDPLTVAAMRGAFITNEVIGYELFERDARRRRPPYALVERGFVSRAVCELHTFMEHAADLFTRHPVTSVRLSGCCPRRDFRRNINVWIHAGLATGSPVEYGAVLPPEIYDRLEPDDAPTGVQGGYADGFRGMEAASRAAVAFGLAERDRLWAIG